MQVSEQAHNAARTVPATYGGELDGGAPPVSSLLVPPSRSQDVSYQVILDRNLRDLGSRPSKTGTCWKLLMWREWLVKE